MIAFAAGVVVGAVVLAVGVTLWAFMAWTETR
jgi:hypothetical protein